MRYVQGERKDEGCIFCLAAEPGDDEARLVLRRGERCLMMLNAFPYNSGHLMVSPHRHVASIEDLDEDELLELMTLAQRALGAVRDVYGPDGFNLGVNEGAIAGAGFADHVHLHVVPRWAADSNFMAVTADTRVLPQSLEDSYAQLRERFTGRETATPTPAKLLVVTNRTADSDEVHAALVRRAHEGPIDVTLLAPAAWEVVDPHGGRQSAWRRLNAALTRLAAAGITARGVVGDADPVAAVQNIWEAERFDEVIVATLPHHRSRWLGRDLPQRVEELTGLPTRHVVATERSTVMPSGEGRGE